MGWTAPYHLSQNDPGRIGHIEGDLCRLDSGLLIAMTLSSDTFVLTIWGIQVSETFRVGPDNYFQSDFDWTGVPGYESIGGLDPYWPYQFNDVNFVLPVGDYTFGIFGSGGDTRPGGDPDDYTIVAWFQIDPDTLVVTRHSETATHYNDIYPDESTGGRYQNSILTLPSSGSGYTDDIARSTIGTYAPELYDLWAAVPGFNRPGPIAVTPSGWVVAQADHPGNPIYSFHVSNPLYIQTVAGPIDGNYTWAMMGVGMPDGRVAFTTPGPSADGTNDPVWLLIVDPDPLTIVAHFQVAPTARNVGWTGGWYSNVRSIDVEPNSNRLVMGYSVAGRARVAVVDPDTHAIDTDEEIPFDYFGLNTFIVSVRVIADGRYAAIYVTQRYGDYGVYFSYMNVGVVRKYPRDDARGFSTARRSHPASSAQRIVGGFG